LKPRFRLYKDSMYRLPVCMICDLAHNVDVLWQMMEASVSKHRLAYCTPLQIKRASAKHKCFVKSPHASGVIQALAQGEATFAGCNERALRGWSSAALAVVNPARVEVELRK